MSAVTDETTPPTPAFPKLQTVYGGVSEMPPMEDILERIRAKDDYKTRPNQYNASGLMSCFRAAWFADRDVTCDHGIKHSTCRDCEFDVGIAKPGNATEDFIRKLTMEVLSYGREGSVLNDLRFSHPLEVEWVEEDADGKEVIVKSTAFVVAKADMTIIGDNLEVLAQTEVKSPVYQFKKALTDVAKSFGSKRVPLAVAGVKEPENPTGVNEVHHLAQLAFTSHKLALEGRKPRLSILLHVSRTNYRDHLEVLLTPEQNEHLFDMAMWWVRENHTNLQFDDVPPPEYFTSWACKYCHFQKRCATLVKKTGEERHISDVMVGLNQRLQESQPFEDPEAA